MILKGKFLKNNELLLKDVKIEDGSKLLLMGKPEEKSQNLQKLTDNNEVVFQEDLTPDEKAKYFKEVLGEKLPIGLVNLGNTCYLNASM